MDGKAVNIYAYNDDYGVFFYNGTNDSRDAIDALVEDSKTTLKPKYDGFKITKIDGLEPETEIFTEDKAVGNGIFITGSRVPEQYIDIVAVGAGLDRTHIYYKYAKDFHKVGEWYKLNIQYQGRWVKAYGILKAFKITPQNVFKRQEITLSYMIPNPTIDTYWHTIFNINKLATYETSAAASGGQETEVIDLTGMRNADYPVLVVKIKDFPITPTADSSANKSNIKFNISWRDANGKKKSTLWTVFYFYQTGTDTGRTVNLGGTNYSGKTISDPVYLRPYIKIKLNLNPNNRKYYIYARLKNAVTGNMDDEFAINASGSSWTNKVAQPLEIESIKISISKDADATVTWEAEA